MIINLRNWPKWMQKIVNWVLGILALSLSPQIPFESEESGIWENDDYYREILANSQREGE